MTVILETRRSYVDELKVHMPRNQLALMIGPPYSVLTPSAHF